MLALSFSFLLCFATAKLSVLLVNFCKVFVIIYAITNVPVDTIYGVEKSAGKVSQQWRI